MARYVTLGTGRPVIMEDPLTASFLCYPRPLDWAWVMHEWLSYPGWFTSYYAEYLESDLWCVVIRPRVLDRDGYQCWRCTHRGDDVHHASYHPLVMAGFADEWLFTVCRRCHDIIHKGKDDKQELAQLFSRLTKRGLLRQRRQQQLRKLLDRHLPTPEQVALWQKASAPSREPQDDAPQRDRE